MSGLPESRILGNRYDKQNNNGLLYSDYENTPRTVYFDASDCVMMDKKYIEESNEDIKTWSDVFDN